MYIVPWFGCKLRKDQPPVTLAAKQSPQNKMRSRALDEDHLYPLLLNSTWTSACSATWDQRCDSETQQRALKPSDVSESLCSKCWLWSRAVRVGPEFCFLTSSQALVTAASLRNKKLRSKSRLQHLWMCMCACALSCVRLFATPWTVAHRAPLSMT